MEEFKKRTDNQDFVDIVKNPEEILKKIEHSFAIQEKEKTNPQKSMKTIDAELYMMSNRMKAQLFA